MFGNETNGYGLFWPYLFSLEEEKEQRNFIKEVKERYDRGDTGDYIINLMSPSRDLYHTQHELEYMTKACERVALKFMLFDTELAKEFLTEEELIKAKETYSRKQYGSKLLEKLTAYFCIMLSYLESNPSVQSNNYKTLFYIPISNEYQNVKNEETDRSFGVLKKHLEKIASGVKADCFMEADNGYRSPYSQTELRADLNEYTAQHEGYDFNKANNHGYNYHSFLLHETRARRINRILQNALLDNGAFWEKHPNFDVIAFINAIAKRNDVTRARKVISHVFGNIKNMPNGKLVIENGFSLHVSMYDDLRDALEEVAFNWTFRRLEQYCDLSKLEGIKLCHPINTADPSILAQGKTVWENFICKYSYPTEAQAVTEYIRSEIRRFTEGNFKNDRGVAIILDSSPFTYKAESEDRDVFTAYHPDCFSKENIMNRVYLKAYSVTLLTDDEQMQFAFLQRIFFDLLKTLENTKGFRTAHQLDNSARDAKFTALKEKLFSYGIETSDEKKHEYTVALLDRDVARMDEVEIFPVLEQLGDAIYGLAVAEMLFYDPNEDEMQKHFEDFTRAEAQIEISKKCGFHQLYLHHGLPRKYTDDEDYYNNAKVTSDYNNYSRHGVERYLADSLEMIIGAICLDKGHMTALEFTKIIVRQAYPDRFSEEVRTPDGLELNEDIEKMYWSKILPSPEMEDDSYYRLNDRSTIKNAMVIAVLGITVGTDDIKKRRYITNHHFGSLNYCLGQQFYQVDWPLYYYLHRGLDFVLEKYGEDLRRIYENTLKENNK